jgi:beta-phosphoglucomutase-like phosphatase (HAD superfamily)
MALAPSECMAFEDSENGVLAARDAGITSIVVTTNGYTQHHELPGASLVLDHLGEPGRPCRVLQGDLQLESMLEVEDLRRLHATSGTTAEAAIP